MEQTFSPLSMPPMRFLEAAGCSLLSEEKKKKGFFSLLLRMKSTATAGKSDTFALLPVAGSKQKHLEKKNKAQNNLCKKQIGDLKGGKTQQVHYKAYKLHISCLHVIQTTTVLR